MGQADAIVIGGGIAGLSAARALLSAGVRRVRLLEREAVPCAHSSGRNAAIFRQLSTTPGDLDLALRSAEMLGDLVGGEGAWLRRTGTFFVAEDGAALDPLAALAARSRLPHEIVAGEDLHHRIPSLRGGPLRRGLWCPGDGVIDIHAVTQALLRAVAEGGGEISLGAEVAGIEVEGPGATARVTGVRLVSGDRLAAGAVVIAGGAWAAALGAGAGAPLPLIPKRRHLAQLQITASPAPMDPVVWCLGDELYYRPESGGLLASPCDGDPWPAELPPSSSAGLELLARKLARLTPSLSDASLRRAWACLRTFAPDAAAVVGADPRVAGLYWLAGLGGHGMSGGVAAGEVLAAAFTGRAHPLAKALGLTGRAWPGEQQERAERT